MVYRLIIFAAIFLVAECNQLNGQVAATPLDIALIVTASLSSDKAAKSAYVHIDKMHSSSMLIRLADERKRIAYMKEKGKISAAEKLESEIKLLNEDMVKYFSKHFNYCPIYFYYSSDAEAVLREKNYDLLWLDTKNQATDVNFDTPPYVLMHGPVSYLRWNSTDKFTLHHWDYSKMDYIERTAFPTIGMRKWRRKIRKHNPALNESAYSDLELQIAGLNAVYHNINSRNKK